MLVLTFQRAAIASFLALSLPAMAHEPTAKTALPGNLSAPARGAAAVVDAFHAALPHGDTKAAAALLAADALIFESGEVERSKAKYAAHHLPADAAFAKVVPSTLVRRSGHSNGAMAWIASEGRLTGTYQGKPLDRSTTETMILRRAEQGWKIVHIHWSSHSMKGD